MYSATTIRLVVSEIHVRVVIIQLICNVYCGSYISFVLFEISVELTFRNCKKICNYKMNRLD